MANDVEGVGSSIVFSVEGLEQLGKAADAVDRIATGVSNAAVAINSLADSLARLSAVSKSIRIPKIPTQVAPTVAPTTVPGSADSSGASRMASSMDQAANSAARAEAAVAGVAGQANAAADAASQLNSALAQSDTQAQGVAASSLRVADALDKAYMSTRELTDGLRRADEAATGIGAFKVDLGKNADLSSTIKDTESLSANLMQVGASSESIQALNTATAETAQVTGAASSATRRMKDEQGNWIEVVNRGNSSLANQRYALYDVADAYRGVATAATAWTAATVGTAVLFEDQFSDVVRTVGLTGDAVAAMKDEFLDLSSEIPSAFGELTDIGALGGQLGIAEDGVIDFTSVVSKLGTTTDLTTDAAAFMVGRFQTLLDVDPSQFEALGSAVLAVGIDSVATESEIANLSTELAAISAQAGLSAQDIIALSATLSSAGIPAERARSAIQDSFGIIDKTIRDNGEELQIWADLAGVSVEEFKAAWGTADFMGVFQGAIEGLEKAGSRGSAVLESLGITNMRTESTLLTLAASTELLDRSLENSYMGWSNATELADQFGIKADTVASRVIMLKNEAMALFNVFGSSVVEASWFDNVISVAQDATWALREFVEAFPGADVAVGLVTTGTTIIGVMASLRAAKALVTAASYAVVDAQAALQESNGSTARTVYDLVRAVFNQKNSLEVLEPTLRETQVANQQLASSYAGLVSGTSAAADAQRLHAMTMEQSISFTGEAAMVTGQETAAMATNTATTTVATQTQRRWRDEIDLSALSLAKLRAAHDLNNAKVALQTIVTGRSTTQQWLYNASVVAAQKAVNGLASAIKFMGTMMKGVLIGGAFMLAMEGIAWVLDKVRNSADATGASIAGLSDAIARDTASFEDNGEAVFQMAVAHDKFGNVAMSSLSSIEDGASVVDLQTEAINNLASSSSTASFEPFIRAQAGMKEQIDEVNRGLETQMVYVGQASLQAMWEELKGSELGSFLTQMARYEELGQVATGTTEGLVEAFVKGEMSAKDFAEMMDLLNIATYERKNTPYTANMYSIEEIEEATEALAELYGIQDPAIFEDLKESVGGAKSAFEEMGVAGDYLADALGGSALGRVWETITGMDVLGESANFAADSLDGTTDAAFDSLDAQLTLASGMYALGEALFTNGVNFDIFSQAGRDNMSALDASIEAAVTNANGDAVALAQALATINQALVDNGMSAVAALELVTQRYHAIQSGKTGGAVIGLGVLRNQIQQAVPDVQTFGRALNEGYTDAMNRAAQAGGGRAGRSARDLGKEARKAAKDVRTLSDYVSDLSKVMDQSFKFRWGLDQSLDDTADAWEKMKDWADSAAKSIKDAEDSIKDANKAIRDAKNELRSLSADMAALKSEEADLEFFLSVAVNYGDVLRAKEIEAELMENRAKQAENQADQDDTRMDVDTGQQELTEATKALSKANQDAQKDLSGTTASAREQRDMVWSLLQSYQDQIQAYADTGVSTEELERYTRSLKGEFESQLTQLGYNQTEVRKYSTTFTDLTTVIKNVPRNITVDVNADPAKRALDEFRAKMADTRSDIAKTKNTLAGLGGVDLSGVSKDVEDLGDDLWEAGNEAKWLYDNLGSIASFQGIGKGMSPRLAAWGLSTGGVVPNTPAGFAFERQGTDTIPAMLTPGEYVFSKPAVDAIGVGYLEALHRGRGVAAPGSTYVSVATPGVQIVELMPHQFNAMVSAVSANVGRAMVSGADLSVATARANQRAVRAGAN